MKHRAFVMVVLLILFAGVMASANAASSASVGFTGSGAGTPYQGYSITAIPDANDSGSGYDYLCVVTYNGNNEIFDIDVNMLPTSSEETSITNSTDPVGLGDYVEPLSLVITDPDKAYDGNENSQEGAEWCASFPAPGSDVPAPSPSEPVPGCDALITIPSQAVMGQFVADAPLYWAPGKLLSPGLTIQAGKTYRVIGQDASGEYRKILMQCQYLWVPFNSVGPNPDAVWNSAPLPTTVVE